MLAGHTPPAAGLAAAAPPAQPYLVTCVLLDVPDLIDHACSYSLSQQAVSEADGQVLLVWLQMHKDKQTELGKVEH